MIISSLQFLPFYIIFIIIGTLERVRSTFFSVKVKPTNTIYYKWIYLTLFYGYLGTLFLSIGEYILRVKVVMLSHSALGFLVFVIGSLLRRKAIENLGENWSVYIELKKGHELITNGIYKFLKHPYSLAVLLELIGICLIANAFYSLWFVLLYQVPLLLIRSSMEEKILTKHFGESYVRYKRNKIL